MSAKYRIITKNDPESDNYEGIYLNANTDKDSWFTLDEAREIVNREAGQIIVEHNGYTVLWEVF